MSEVDGAGPQVRHGGSPGRSRGRGRGRGGGDRVMVPEADFTSYYGRPIVKAAPWEHDIAYYLFTGGVAAGTSLLAAGADLTDRPGLRRAGRIGSLIALLLSMVALVHDLGRPSRFLNMLRVVKLTSPMSVGTWILTLHAPFASLATAAELVGMLPTRWQRGPVRLLLRLGRPAGLVGAITAPPVAAYTAVLIADTATPAWHSAYEELPFVFCGSAAAASGGWCMATAPVAEAGPARAFAVGGAAVELVMAHRMEASMGLSAETLHTGVAGRWMRASKVLTVAGAAGALAGGRSRMLSAVAGTALMAGSLCTRMGVYEAGLASANDPKYTVVPQRERVERGEQVRHQG
ncbi:NrfD/PsrC family molybdoenzyme membrane anchor subunit [Nocardioides sp. zg-1228]|uniref:NrfD/PsrC family molybdoenzyme membrane anchor subunit n=1 Tax=Nocardioides sp. zg-1228 TaxID=2763008 RepID=UPI00197DFF75|nr:NrfD/PsrC family molybdoenzyme membrane anchor subunit [Nocardioides sp. zg-1228]QSF57730.1 polysulfide reductase NrfD [Nocardioides sp. zg-1228]